MLVAECLGEPTATNERSALAGSKISRVSPCSLFHQRDGKAHTSNVGLTSGRRPVRHVARLPVVRLHSFMTYWGSAMLTRGLSGFAAPVSLSVGSLLVNGHSSFVYSVKARACYTCILLPTIAEIVSPSGLWGGF